MTKIGRRPAPPSSPPGRRDEVSFIRGTVTDRGVSEQTVTRAPEGASVEPDPSDYGALNAVYAALLAAAILAARERSSREDPIAATELLPMAAATFALSKAVAREKIGSWIREPFVADEHGASEPARERMRRAVGELLTCTRCVGAWSALGIVGLRAVSPPTGRIVTAVFATSALNDFGQAAFRVLCNRANST
jgi:Protein of unknown function (DUF1360)